MKYCQTNEDQILNRILKLLNIKKGFAVEFGGGNGFTLSNIRHLVNDGWTIFQIDADNKGNEEVKREFLTIKNINQIFTKYDLLNIDVLSIDIDGNDYWIWKELKEQAKIVIIEFNPNIQGSKAIKYNPNHKFDRTDYYGASWEAFKRLGKKKGYTLVDCNSLNMFFVKDEILVPQLKQEVQKPVFENKKRGWPHNKKGEWVDVS